MFIIFYKILYYIKIKMKMKNEERLENEESKNFSGIWDKDNPGGRISKINIYFYIYFIRQLYC